MVYLGDSLSVSGQAFSLVLKGRECLLVVPTNLHIPVSMSPLPSSLPYVLET